MRPSEIAGLQAACCKTRGAQQDSIVCPWALAGRSLCKCCAHHSAQLPGAMPPLTTHSASYTACLKAASPQHLPNV